MRALFVGDVMLGRQVNKCLQHEPPTYSWGDTLPIFGGATVRMCNVECVLSDHGEPWRATPKVFHFRSDAKNIAVLQAAHLDAVSLANNHALDFGYEAFADMLSLLDASAIPHAGAGRTLQEAMQPAVVRTSEGSVSLLAFTDNEPSWEATPEKPGLLYVPVGDAADPRVKRLLSLVRQTRATTQYLVVSAHWGSNWGSAPPPEHVLLGHALIKAGADVVFGHSAHVVRGIEIYRRRPILYSAGDFIDDYAIDPVDRNDESFIFALEVQRRRLKRIELYPTVIEDMQARRARGDRAERIAGRMKRLSSPLGTPMTWRAPPGYLEVTSPAPAPSPVGAPMKAESGTHKTHTG